MNSATRYAHRVGRYLIFLLCAPGVLIQQQPASAYNPQTQSQAIENAINLYERGDFAASIKSLQAILKETDTNTRVWHYLGLALGRQGKKSDARKAHEKAVVIATRLITGQLRDATSDYYRAHLVPLRSQLVDLAESADQVLLLSTNPSPSTISIWTERAEFFRNLIDVADHVKVDKIYKAFDVTTRARITSKPSPVYTQEARNNKTSGNVALQLILSADGKVKSIIPLKSLPDGLTEMSISVARQIKFEPALLDGKPVWQFMRVEYNFNIY